jgi:methyl-accepting chemotaxis protein
MNWLSCISVRAKLALLSATFSLGLVLMAGMSLWSLDQAVSASQSLVDSELEAVRALGDARAGVGNMRRFEKDLFLNLAEEEQLNRYHEAWRREVQGTQATLDRLQPLLPEAERAAAQGMRAAIGRYAGVVESIVKNIQIGQINDPWAANKAMEPSKAEIRTADQAIGQIGEGVTRRMNDTAAALATLERQVRVVSLTSAAVVLAAALVLAYLIASRISTPLQEAVQVIEQVAGGDLTVTVRSRGSDETARVMHGIARMQQSLIRIVGQIRSGVETVAHASAEIATGNQDLSNRTEAAASNLQETAASMVELNSTMHSSAEAARTASQLAVANAEVAARGGQVVGQVVATMEEINHSSKKISDIIGVIDGIAFQTNILALNAAVEAARAGEQGRGFAVVAGEVRNLAQRSAEAAKEIKGLIGTSVDRVEAGTRLVGEAGSTIGEVVANAQRVADMIGEITAASGEQSRGVGQVNAAVNQLDQMTQQNAALVEESAAAAATLRSSAEHLNLAVAVFRLPA